MTDKQIELSIEVPSETRGAIGAPRQRWASRKSLIDTGYLDEESPYHPPNTSQASHP